MNYNNQPQTRLFITLYFTVYQKRKRENDNLDPQSSSNHRIDRSIFLYCIGKREKKMRINHIRVQELATSWINGNRSFIRNEVKKLTKLEFYFLVCDICSRTNDDEERTANSLVNNI